MGNHILQNKRAKTLLAAHVLLYSIIKKKPKNNITQESKAFTLQTAKTDGDLFITEKNFAHATTVFSELYRARGQNYSQLLKTAYHVILPGLTNLRQQHDQVFVMTLPFL